MSFSLTIDTYEGGTGQIRKQSFTTFRTSISLTTCLATVLVTIQSMSQLDVIPYIHSKVLPVNIYKT